ncbi:MAG: potassium channel family protein [Alphaproteobacteria bacterium]|nr:potassium channel family protein [Alphaproteobacteria bacterium]
MLTQFAFAFALILLTVVIQGLWLDRVMRRTGAWAKRLITLLPRAGRGMTMAVVALAALLPHILALLLWTLFYVYVAGAGQDDALFEPAFYFAATAYTTTGFGDITMNESWRVLSTLQALGGLLMFAWTAAFLFEVQSRLYRTNKDRA